MQAEISILRGFVTADEETAGKQNLSGTGGAL